MNLYVGTLFMHPTNPDILLAGTGNNAYPDGGGVYLTTNGGTSWQAVVSHENYNAIEFALSNPNIAYAGSAGAVYRSSDHGQTWRKVSTGEEGWGSPGVRAGFPIDFQVDPRDPNRVFANNYGGGNFLSVDGGQTWNWSGDRLAEGMGWRVITFAPSDSKILYADSSGFFSAGVFDNTMPAAGVYVSRDAGATWNSANDALSEKANISFRVPELPQWPLVWLWLSR